MSVQPNIIVAGLARCGTSLVMQMLHAAGIPCVGEYPSFEVPDTNHRPISTGFLAAHPDRAFKLLDPHEAPLPDQFGPAYVIWLDRDPWQQAKSQAKFACATLGVPSPNREHMRRWARGLRLERAPALAAFRDWPLLVLDFEGLLDRPAVRVGQIAAFLRPAWPDLPQDRMTSLVKRRSPLCSPDLSIEFEALAAGGAL